MAIILPSTPFKYARGKFAKQDDIYFQKRKNKQVGVRQYNPYDGGSSTLQVNNRTRFAQIQQQAISILKDAEQRETYTQIFRKQRRYTTLRGFIVAQLYKKQP